MTPAVCDINSLLPKVKPSTLLPLDDVLTRVRDVAECRRRPTRRCSADGRSSTGAIKLSYAAEGDPTADFGFEARVVPENVTLLPKTTAQTNGGSDWSERIVTAKKGETVGSILRELGAAPDEIKQIIAVLGPAAAEGGSRKASGCAC